jgi:hypothetical protein
MPTKPVVTARVSGDKLIIELGLPAVRARVIAVNRMFMDLNREDPREQAGLYRITDGRAFLKYLLTRLQRQTESAPDGLPDLLGLVVEESLPRAARAGAGIEKLPWDSTEAEGMSPARGRKRIRRTR